MSKGAELTLGYGLYDYDWGHYKLVLLFRALDTISLLGLHQNRPDIVAYAEILLDIAREVSSFSTLESHNKFPHELVSVVNGSFSTACLSGRH